MALKTYYAGDKLLNDQPHFMYYVDELGHSEFCSFLQSLPPKEANKVLAVIKFIEEIGMLQAQQIQLVKKIETNLFEIRIQYHPDFIRCLYFRKNKNNYVVTHGFKKKTNKLPVKEKNHAENIRQNFFNRKEP